MIVAMQDKALEEHIQQVIERMVELGFNVHRTTGATQTILAGVGTSTTSMSPSSRSSPASMTPTASPAHTNSPAATSAPRAPPSPSPTA